MGEVNRADITIAFLAGICTGLLGALLLVLLERLLP